MTKEENDKLETLLRKDPSLGRRRLSALSGVSENRVQLWLKKRSQGTLKLSPKTVSAVPVVVTKGPVGRSIAEFRNTFDKNTIVPAKIKAALKALGPNGWEYELQFVRLAGLNQADLGNFRDMFADFIVPLKDRRAWAGSKKTAIELKGML